MISDGMLREAIYNLKFAQQGGVHDGWGNDVRKMDVEDALDELLRRLYIRPVTIPKFYTFHWYGDEEADYKHVKSHLSGRRYGIKQTRMEKRITDTVYIMVDAIAILNGPETVLETEHEVKDVIGRYERERGFVGGF